jgi:hypothetical protein
MKVSDYREHAEQCRRLARMARPDMRPEIERTADMWELLADDCEAYQRRIEIKAYVKKWHLN